MTAEQKAIAEYWADGPLSSTPPGHWNEFAHDLSARETYGLADDVKMFFALNNALFDTGIAVWDAKYAHDYVCPQTAIRHLYEDKEIVAWAHVIRGFSASEGDRLLLDAGVFGDDASLGVADSRRQLKQMANDSDFDLLYFQPKGRLFFNENGDEAGFGYGGLFCTIKNVGAITPDQIALV